jgi:hypothetical protein
MLQSQKTIVIRHQIIKFVTSVFFVSKIKENKTMIVAAVALWHRGPNMGCRTENESSIRVNRFLESGIWSGPKL